MSRTAFRLALLLAVACAAPEEPALLELRGAALGTSWSVKVVQPAPERARLVAEVEAVLAEVDAQMSTWRDDSELSRFNRARSTAWLPVSGPLARVVAEALLVSGRSGGAFDPTVAPLVALWGFGPGGARPLPPRPEEIAAARAHVGRERVLVRERPPALRKLDPAVALDLSGVAKGWAVDAVSARLAALGARDHLVEIGGELRASGRRGRAPWRAGIERPVAASRELQALVALSGEGLATSGDYRNFQAHDGRRLGHVLDPRTGAPVSHGLASVSVIADTAMRADALATALLVLGPEDGFALAESEQLAVLFVVATPAGFVERTTLAFERRRAGEQTAR